MSDYFSEEVIDACTFSWQDLDGKVLTMMSRTEIIDGLEVTCTIGYENLTGKMYFLHTNSKKTP